MAKKWLPVKDAAEVMGVSDRTVRRWIDDKKYKTRRINKVRHVLIDDFTEPSQSQAQPKETPDNRQANDGQQSKSSQDTQTEREKDQRIAQLIKDLDEQKGMLDWLKKGYEQLQITHYETASALNKIQLQLTAPKGEKTADGEVVGMDIKSSSEGIVDAKKAKILNDVTQLLVVFVLIGVLIAVVVLTMDTLRP